MEYVFACENGGKCREIMYENYGWNITGPESGTKNLFNDLPVYTCCTGCHQPINSAEAIRLNKLLGNELTALPEIDISEFEDF